jgi:P4 family phage/plasmid primase-like protien
MIDFVQRLAGYSALGEVTHHVLPFLFGAGGNGKSVFLDVLIAALGDYASTAPADFLMAGGRDDENAVARLSGLRLVVCSEVEQTARFNESKIKVLTGGDRLTARFLYQRHFTFTPTTPSG